jgi:WD40 repeat protein
MKIKYILEAIGPKGLRDRTEKSFEGKEITLGRGSSCDVLLASRLVSFKHAKISIADDKLYLEELEGQAGTTFVNNQAASKGSLVPGDSLKIGDVVLKIELKDDVWSLIEVRSSEGQLDAKEEVKKQLDLLTVAKRVPSIYVWALAVVIPVLVFLFAAPYGGLNESIWESGPMTRSHKFLQTNCGSCHEKNFEMVSDDACKKCHKMGDHVDFLTTHSKFNEKCGSCHREHINEDALILSKSELCLHCHANIQEINVESEYPAINGFNQTHPDFELVRTKKVDRAKLKLNHKYHLHTGLIDIPGTEKKEMQNGVEVVVEPPEKRPLTCPECHVPDQNGEYMGPVTFDKYCKDCHKLKVGGAGSEMLRVPHVKTNLVRTFLKNPEDFLYEHIDAKPGDLMEVPEASGSGRRSRRSRKPKPPPAPVQKPRFDWVKNNIKEIDKRGGLLKNENAIYFAADGCIECHELDVSPVGDISSDGSFVAVSLWEHDLRLWDRENGKDKAILRGHKDIVNSASFSADGTRLVTSSKDFTARVWGVLNEAERVVSEQGEAEKSESEVEDSVEENMESSAERVANPEQESLSEVKVIGPELIESSFVFRGHEGSVNDAVFSPNKEMILTGSEDGFAIIWDVNTQKPIKKLQEKKKPVKKVRFNSDGSLAVALYSVNESVLDANTKEVGSEFNASVWEVDTGDLKSNLRTRNQQIVDVEFSPTKPSKIAAAFSEGSIRIYDLNDKSGLVKLTPGAGPLGKASGHSLEVTAITYSSDGSRLASVSRDRSAKVWDVNSGKVLSTMAVFAPKKKKEKEKEDGPRLADQRFVSISFSQDGQKVLTGSTDNKIRLWNINNSEKPEKEFGGHENVVSLVVFAKKADYFLTVSDENLAVLRDLNSKSKTTFGFGGTQKIAEKIIAAKAAETEAASKTAEAEVDKKNKKNKKDKKVELRLPKIVPTNVPSKFFEKGFFSHRKHEYLECNNCHADAKESIFTSDILLPSIKPCRICHEKEGVQLNRCVVCHFYHPEDERKFEPGLMTPDQTAKLGYSYFEKKKVESEKAVAEKNE